MLKIITSFTCLTVFFSVAFAQGPVIQWQKSLGGSNQDVANSIQQTLDGGYIVAGSTKSNNGDITGNHGGKDIWIVKLDDEGSIQWQKNFGGTTTYEYGGDGANSIKQTIDGGYIIAGSTSSTDGDVTGNHGSMDFWILKLDSVGHIQWQKALGGMYWDGAGSIQQTIDGGYIAAGASYSNDGNVSGHHGTAGESPNAASDCWVVKLDSAGHIQWQKSLGGINDDRTASIQQTTEGGYILAGTTSSNDGDVSGNHGNSDYWVVKLDSGGTILWQKTLGGTKNDQATSIQQTADDGYIVAGSSISEDGDISDPIYEWDYWIVKLDSGGNILWEKSLGGTNDDFAEAIHNTIDGGCIIAGVTQSNVPGYHGNLAYNNYSDYFTVKLDSNGNIQWQKAWGGHTKGGDEAYSIQQTTDEGYIMAGYSYSTDGDVSGNHGLSDYWIVKLCMGTSTTTTVTACDSYTWNGQTYTSSGLYTHYIGSAEDCNMEKLRLTIQTINTEVTVDGNELMAEQVSGTHQWINCETGEIIYGETGRFFTPTTSGSYAVAMKSGLCADTSDCYTINLLDIEKPEMDTWQIYPNPSGGIVNMTGLPHSAQITVLDIYGKTLFMQQVNDTKAAFDLSGLPSGVYFIRVWTEYGDSIKKVIRN